MADNFLEKRMEDLLSGRLKPVVKRKRILPLQGKCYFVADGATAEKRCIVERLRREGATVAFSGDDESIANVLVKVYGAIWLTQCPPDFQAIPNSDFNTVSE